MVKTRSSRISPMINMMMERNAMGMASTSQKAHICLLG